MGLLTFTFGGIGLILVGSHESFLFASSCSSSPNKNKTPSPLFWIATTIFSSLLALNSTLSLIDAHTSNDVVGTALQLELIPVALIFFFLSILHLRHVTLPSSLLALIAAFAFTQEFLLFYLRRKDPTGVENRYYDLLLVPITLCLLSTLLQFKSPQSSVPKLGRAVGLVLHGTWLLQMGLSIFSGWAAQGCYLNRVSRGNYTLKCKGHPEYHRAKAIATLQFNCHLAFLVLVLVAAFAVVSGRNGLPLHVDSAPYAPLGAQLQRLDNDAENFTLDSDDDDDDDDDDGNDDDYDTREDKVLVVANASH